MIKAIYRRHHQSYDDDCESPEEAAGILLSGSNDGDLFIIGVLNTDERQLTVPDCQWLDAHERVGICAELGYWVDRVTGIGWDAFREMAGWPEE